MTFWPGKKISQCMTCLFVCIGSSCVRRTVLEVQADSPCNVITPITPQVSHWVIGFHRFQCVKHLLLFYFELAQNWRIRKRMFLSQITLKTEVQKNRINFKKQNLYIHTVCTVYTVYIPLPPSISPPVDFLRKAMINGARHEDQFARLRT